MRIEDDVKLDFDDVLIKPKRSIAASRSSVQLKRQFSFPYSPFAMNAIPLIASNMDSTGTWAMAKTLGSLDCMTALHKFYDVLEYRQFTQPHIWHTIGIREAELTKLNNIKDLLGYFPDRIVIDVANGYTEQFVDFVRSVRELAKDSIIMAGNVATAEMTQEIIINGKADIVKIGIGPGSVCTTRLKTGVGYPQLSAIAECADVAHGLNAHVCADGGCKTPGDVAKAFGAGADFVVIGGMLAGTEECEGKWKYDSSEKNILGFEAEHETVSNREFILYPERFLDAKEVKRNKEDRTYNITRLKPIYKPQAKKSLHFHGMSSREAMEQHSGTVADYKAAEGVEIEVPYKGAAANVIKDILGGLRSACAYVGADSIKHLPKACTFIRVNRTKEYLYDIGV